MSLFPHPESIDSLPILRRRVAVIGYGAQGRAQALNLRDSGGDVRVGLYRESGSWLRAQAEGMRVLTVADAVKIADVVVLCTPDPTMASIYTNEIEPHLRTGTMLIFSHGFAIHHGTIHPPESLDVALVAPKGPGRTLRENYLADGGLAAGIAIHQDATGEAEAIALAYAAAIGCARVALLQTTFAEETVTDLFGEQAVLCGGIPALIKAGFETLVEAGYSPEAAYFECLHEAKFIVDLLHERGLEGMHAAISSTADWGGLIAGPEVIGESSRVAMRGILAHIQSGEFAREWIAEHAAGEPRRNVLREQDAQAPIEQVGAEIRRALNKGGARETGSRTPQAPD